MTCIDISSSFLYRWCHCDTAYNSKMPYNKKQNWENTVLKKAFGCNVLNKLCFTNCRYVKIVTHLADLLTSSADWAIKNPCVIGSTLMDVPGLMAMLASVPSSRFVPIAISSNFSRMKHNLSNKRHWSHAMFPLFLEHVQAKFLLCNNLPV